MIESFASRRLRWGFNLYPAYRGTGARITYIADDYREVRIELPLSWRTRNYVGTIFGGSMYAAVDPVYMIMLIKTLGPGYIVWDKAASIRFRKPARTKLYAHFHMPPEELDAIRASLTPGGSIDRVYWVELTDRAGTVHAEMEKTIHIQRREAR